MFSIDPRLGQEHQRASESLSLSVWPGSRVHVRVGSGSGSDRRPVAGKESRLRPSRTFIFRNHIGNPQSDRKKERRKTTKPEDKCSAMAPLSWRGKPSDQLSCSHGRPRIQLWKRLASNLALVCTENRLVRTGIITGLSANSRLRESTTIETRG